MSTLWPDLRFAGRMLLKSPGYTLIAVAVLALGIGANTAVFSVINAVLLRPLPYPHSDRLVIVRETAAGLSSGSVSYPNYLDWRGGQRSFTDLALARSSSCNVSFATTRGMTPERIASADVTANFLSILGLHPALGRDFSVAEDTLGGPKVAMLGDALWRRRFGADPAVLGHPLLVDGVAREIIGVLPPEVGFPRTSELFIPLGDLRADPIVNARGNHPSFSALGRLKPGVTLARAEQDLDNVALELERRFPDTNTTRRVRVWSMLDFAVGSYREGLCLLLGAVGCVLLIACANAANLQLARASGRRKELAVRAALGAGRGRLVRQMLTESALLGLLGGAVALLVALWATDAIVALSPGNVPRFHQVRLDFAALGFTALVALGTGLLVGVWPAWRISGIAAMATALHEGSARGGTGGLSQGRTRSLLVVTQVALAMVLLAGAALTLQSFWRMQDVPLGFRRDGLLTMSLSLPAAKYTKENIPAFEARVLERVRALPGVGSAAVGVCVPFTDEDWDSSFHVTGTPDYPPGKEPSASLNFVSPGYFKTIGTPLLRGRDFDARDLAGPGRSVVIDDGFARAYFSGQDPVGKQIDDNVSATEEHAPPMTVIGVVGHTLADAPGNTPRLENMVQMILCASQSEVRDIRLLIRAASGDPLLLTESVRQAVLSVDPQLPVADVSTMEANIAASHASRRLTMVLLGTFAVLALVLASIGLYGVMALSVTQRTRELGIRLALGAQRPALLGLVMRQGAGLVGIGLGLGVVGALASGRLLRSILFGAGGSEALTLGIVAVVLAVSALLACWLPARRAMKVDPMIALRNE